MTIPIIAFFNNKGGVGKTSLVYHLAWMYQNLGLRVVAADLDPQVNLTTAFLDDDRLEELWGDNGHNIDNQQPNTIFRCIQPLIKGIGDIAIPQLEIIDDNLALLAGDLSLSVFEDDLSVEWWSCMDGKERSFQLISAFWRVLQSGTKDYKADMILMDLGPNLGAINRAALIGADYVVVPLSPDLLSLQGLKNLGPTLRRWRDEWTERLQQSPGSHLKLPRGKMQPIGYVVLRHPVRLDTPVKAFKRWVDRIPGVYREEILQDRTILKGDIHEDSNCLAQLKHYQSLIAMALEAHKPIFSLKPADGAMGAHQKAVQSVYQDFQKLAQKIADSILIS
ncbi:MAG: hypothetical protein RLZZ29_366 [Cyanobacteriota bacterium]|jgi:cellulose biosynthesis protein BcsQ|uniref:ParA family protein n=1 Tax=Cylindrospermopsis raciborskii TaxID=77022 RepID=UPI0034F60A11